MLNRLFLSLLGAAAISSLRTTRLVGVDSLRDAHAGLRRVDDAARLEVLRDLHQRTIRPLVNNDAIRLNAHAPKCRQRTLDIRIGANREDQQPRSTLGDRRGGLNKVLVIPGERVVPARIQIRERLTVHLGVAPGASQRRHESLRGQVRDNLNRHDLPRRVQRQQRFGAVADPAHGEKRPFDQFEGLRADGAQHGIVDVAGSRFRRRHEPAVTQFENSHALPFLCPSLADPAPSGVSENATAV